jgi:predicted RNA-binding protein YlxR (DUF448 family)
VAKKTVRQKHIPQRTCVGCHEVEPKRSLIRIVRGVSGVEIDLTGKHAGRGAYLHDQRSCWEKGLKGSLARALKTELTSDERQQLAAFAQSLDMFGSSDQNAKGMVVPQEGE